MFQFYQPKRNDIVSKLYAISLKPPPDLSQVDQPTADNGESEVVRVSS